MLTASEEPPLGWPDPSGTVRDVALQPLHHSVPQAVKEDSAPYEMLSLVDAFGEWGRQRAAVGGADLEDALSPP